MADKTANNRVDLFIKDGSLQITAEGSYGRSQEALGVSQEGTESEIALSLQRGLLGECSKTCRRGRALLVLRADESECGGESERYELPGDGGAASHWIGGRDR